MKVPLRSAHPQLTMKFPLLTLLVLISASWTHSHAAVVFTDDFSSGSVANHPNGYVGGWYGSPVPMSQWFGNTTDASIGGGSLTVGTTNLYRNAVIALTPGMFDGAGTYTLTFDVTNYAGDSNDYGRVRVWSGSGYDLSGTSPNALFINSETAAFVAQGTAVVSELANLVFTSSGTSMTLNFDYDGVGLVGVFLGAYTGGYPFPSINYDNVQIAKSVPPPIPEPSAPMMAIVAATLFCLLRRRLPSPATCA